jgi:CRP-like cAMP-binding protein
LLPAQKNIIASRLNLTHEHFSRILHEFAAEALIEVEGRTVRIPDVYRLQAQRGG